MAKKLTTSEFQELVLKQFKSVYAEFAEFRKEMNERFNDIDNRFDSIDAILKPLVKAVDKDAETLVKHGNRIARMEKHLGFK